MTKKLFLIPMFILLWLNLFSLACSTAFSKSGIALTIQVVTDSPNQDQITEQTIKTIERRLDIFDIQSEVKKIASDRIAVTIFGNYDTERLKKILLFPGKLRLFPVVSPPFPAPVQIFPTKESAVNFLENKSSQEQKILKYENSAVPGWIIIENSPIIDTKDLRDAKEFSRTGFEKDYGVGFSLNPAGAQKFGVWTGNNINKYLAVVLDNKVITATYIKSQIFDSGEINGKFTKQEAKDLALILKSGELNAELKIVDERKIDSK